MQCQGRRHPARRGKPRSTTFCSVAARFDGLWLTGDYQHVVNPGFNEDRGPVNIFYREDPWGIFRSLHFCWRGGRGFALRACAPGLAILSARTAGGATANAGDLAWSVSILRPPDGDWFVMDDINISRGLGGAISLTGGYYKMTTFARSDLFCL